MQPYSAMRISASGSIGGRGRLHAKIKIYCERNAVPLRTPSRSPGCSADFQFRLLGHQLTKLLLLESPTAVKHHSLRLPPNIEVIVDTPVAVAGLVVVPAKKWSSFVTFSYVCPEPVLVK